MATCGPLLFLSLLGIVVGGDIDILKPSKRCIATDAQISNCYVCVCKTDGVYYCSAIKCDIYKNTFANQTGPAVTRQGGTDFHSLPEIHDGEPCFPDKLYKMDCNTCRCTNNNALMCTKMACINWKNPKQQGKKVLRQGEIKEKKTYLPTLQRGSACKPGKLYRSKCKRCYCTEDYRLVCSNKPKDACTFDKHGNPPPIQKPEDVRPSIKYAETRDLVRLSSAAKQCTPGKSYMVDCNLCICMESENLLCQRKLCLSYDDMNRLEAKKMSGKPCKVNDPMQSHSCKTCKCVDSKTVCSVVQDCAPGKPEILHLNGKEEPIEQLDPDTDKFKCIPQTVYKIDCNKCYCQNDSSLRCTQKTCLNYSQVKVLEEQRQYLERHGL